MKVAGERYALDTSVLTRMLNGDEDTLSKVSDDDKVCICVIVVGELEYGAFKSARVEFNLHRIASFCADAEVLPITETTSRHYGFIKAQLSKSGRPIPDNDIWIAAVAMEHGLPLATRDKHFLEVSGLDTRMW